MFDERDLLLKAASIVEEGWCQGAYSQYTYDYADEGKKWVGSCILGATMRAADALFGNSDQLRLSVLYRAEARLERELSMHPILWNDATGRTKEEVIEALRKAAM